MEQTIPEEFTMMYSSIENEVVDLSYKITFDEKQKGVYSTFIGELELRIFALLESVAKFKGAKEEKKNYDDFFVALFESERAKPHVIVTMNAYKFIKKDYSDVFEMKEKRVSNVEIDGEITLDKHARYNCKYNNAYQNLRHNFINSLPVFGNLEYLFESLAALFIVLELQTSKIFAVYEIDENGQKSIWKRGGTVIRKFV